ncbi:MAG: hypothetical protein BGO01_00405 [Armatimonadetes bacterium 55-13]|nr:MAG: hypothetical protein BGO01_00405 [Armatimonadetes bacterium 55-13]
MTWTSVLTVLVVGALSQIVPYLLHLEAGKIGIPWSHMALLIGLAAGCVGLQRLLARHPLFPSFLEAEWQLRLFFFVMVASQSYSTGSSQMKDPVLGLVVAGNYIIATYCIQAVFRRIRAQIPPESDLFVPFPEASENSQRAIRDEIAG